MEKKTLELIEVEFKDGAVAFTFLDEEAGTIAEVNWNRGVWNADVSTFVANADKAKQVDEWCDKYFGTTFDKLEECVGQVHEVYQYDKFNSLWEVEIVNKFEEDDYGDLFQTQITAIEDTGDALVIKYQYNDQPYQSKMQHSKWIESRGVFMPNPNKLNEQLEKFETKFGVPFEERETLIGQTINVEVKKFGQHFYGDIKPIKKAKK